jgi:hypothetical protein
MKRSRKPFVEAQFRAVHDGLARPLAIRIGMPIQRRTGEWAAEVQLTGLVNRTNVFGEDALQALALALDLVGNTLYAQRRRGVRVQFATGQEIPLAAYFRLRELRRRFESIARSSSKRNRTPRRNRAERRVQK